LIGYSVIVVAPILGLVRILKIFENSNDYSVQNTARQALFLPVSREAKYKAKAAIDSFFWRFDDVLQAGVFYMGTALGFALSAFAALKLAFTGICLAVRRGEERLTNPVRPVSTSNPAARSEQFTARLRRAHGAKQMEMAVFSKWSSNASVEDTARQIPSSISSCTACREPGTFLFRLSRRSGLGVRRNIRIWAFGPLRPGL
jgi:hypothetical protein